MVFPGVLVGSNCLAKDSQGRSVAPLLRGAFDVDGPYFRPYLRVFASRRKAGSFRDFQVYCLRLVVFIGSDAGRRATPYRCFADRYGGRTSQEAIGSVQFVFVFCHPCLLQEGDLVTVRGQASFLTRATVCAIVYVCPEVGGAFFVLVGECAVLETLLCADYAAATLPLVCCACR